MLTRRGYAHGGLMRCCIATLDEAHEIGIFHDAVSMKCMYCRTNMVLDEEREMFRWEGAFNEQDCPPDDWGQP